MGEPTDSASLTPHTPSLTGAKRRKRSEATEKEKDMKKTKQLKRNKAKRNYVYSEKQSLFYTFIQVNI